MHAERYPATEPLPRLVAALGERPGLCWLDGGAGGWSFVGSDPCQTVSRDGTQREPLAGLRELGVADLKLPRSLPPSPFVPSLSQLPRWAGHIAYDAHFPYTRGEPTGDPAAVLLFHRYDAWLATNHDSGQRILVGDDAHSCLRLAQRLQQGATAAAPEASTTGCVGSSGTGHLRAIERALTHITDGDVYQVNLARHYDAALVGHPLALALAMHRQGEVPFGFYIDEGPRQIIGRSMERFLRWDRKAGTVQTAPIKGTRARNGSDDGGDAAALRADPKELAEHAMIVDLMRNDLGRIARTGSVRVSDLMRVEPYARLSHLVSTVHCEPRADLDLETLLQATFPPGSVTGTPKLRALQIIEALEPVARGVYTGAYGFIDQLGGCSLSVAIRTAVVEGGTVRYHAGGGIVEASDPARELAETQLKAKVFTEAIAELQASAKPAAIHALRTPGDCA